LNRVGRNVLIDSLLKRIRIKQTPGRKFHVQRCCGKHDKEKKRNILLKNGDVLSGERAATRGFPSDAPR
jgi:hypothetical protein